MFSSFSDCAGSSLSDCEDSLEEHDEKVVMIAAPIKSARASKVYDFIRGLLLKVRTNGF